MENIEGFIAINCYALILILLIASIFNVKKRLHYTEDNTYFYLLVVTILTTFSGLVLGLLVIPDFRINKLLILLANKIYLVFLSLWTLILTFYTYYISRIKKGKPNKQVTVFVIIGLIVSLLILILPIETTINDNIAVASGLSLYFTYTMIGLGFIAMFVLLLLDHDNMRNKKYLPIYLLAILGSLSLVIQIFTNLNYLINPSLVLIVLIMYFTIENPDMKMLEELYKNKRLLEKSNEETSNFLFKLSADIKNPVKKIIDRTEGIEDLKDINSLGKQLDYLIDDVLDVSSISNNHFKVYNSKYNPKNLFDEISSKFKNSLSSQIEFQYKLSENIPHFVYGDAIKLKQVLSSVLSNSINHTSEGFIEFEVNTIIKYDVCRFIIDITDSGDMINVDKINDILSLKENDENIDLEKSLLNLKEVKYLINKLGGGFVIKSDEEYGTTISITIDQKIVMTSNNEVMNKLDVYEDTLNNDMKIMVVDDDAKELSEITGYLEKNNTIVSGSLFGKDIVQKISNNHKFDLIILDDETNTGSALSVLQELKQNKKFNTPVVVMINDNKKVIEKQYLKDGFNDIIHKSDLKNEIKRVLKKFEN